MGSIDGLKSRETKATSQKKQVKKAKKAKKTIAKAPVISDIKPIDSPQEDIEVNKKIDEDAVQEDVDFDLTREDIKEEEKIVKEAKKKDKLNKKGKKKVSLARKIITSVLLVIVLFADFILCLGFIWGNEYILKITGGKTDIWSAIHTITSETHVKLKTDSKGRTNILVFGTSGLDMDGTSFDGVSGHDGAALTDSIMIISYDQNTHDIAIVSLPRDLKADDTCTATGKVNEVYWCNNMYGDNENAGAQALMAEMNTILGVDIQYYVHINWGSLVYVVDALGGIDITLDEDIWDDAWTGANYDAGVTYHISGAEALALARARHGTNSGDFTRGNSQQKLLIAVKNKIINDGMGWNTALGLINALGDNLRTNVSLDEMKTVLYNIGDMDLDNARQIPLIGDGYTTPSYMTTGTINGISYVLPVEGAGVYDALQEYIAEQFQTPVKEEELLETNETEEASDEDYLYKDY